ncbi:MULTISPECIES: hypothetical protein [Kamptonema]|uniref:hypothetical protein n=1 Tax=Kamptonema TaxID=1501433 RepID=UPI0001DAD5B5|nr:MULTISPECIES: hypothetical protein [Kamptonema]CBN54735.1 conserved hypothetical protein [Kamptonema sp. PCC 6506]
MYTQVNKTIQKSSIYDFRIGFQGKQLSQVIAYIWRWIDEDANKIETQTARALKTYFVKPNASSNQSTDRSNNQSQVNQNLKRLFRADPRAWLATSEILRGERDDNKESKLLISVFGEARIKNQELYISPMFNEAELGERLGGQKGPYYEFSVDVSSFVGVLQDPTVETPYAFRYSIAFPPRPQIGEATVTKDELSDWIGDEMTDNIYPNNLFIPVSTS